MSLSKRTRFDVFKRDRFTCQYCGKRPPDVMLEVDHIHPKCEGGSDDPSNLTTACFACNRGKSGVPLDKVAPALDELTVLEGMQDMLERAASLRDSIAVQHAIRDAEDDAIRAVCDWYASAFGDTEYFQVASVRTFLRRLSFEQVRDAIDATALFVDRQYSCKPWKRWKYFCGVCWAKIRAQGGDDAEA